MRVSRVSCTSLDLALALTLALTRTRTRTRTQTRTLTLTLTLARLLHLIEPRRGRLCSVLELRVRGRN